MVTAGVIVVRVNAKENTVEFYYNQRKQAQYTLKASIKDMKWIKAVAGTKAPKGEPAVVEFIGDQ